MLINSTKLYIFIINKKPLTSNLITMRVRELIDDEQYTTRKKELTEKIAVMKQKVSETPSRALGWFQYTEQVFDFAHIWQKPSLMTQKRA